MTRSEPSNDSQQSQPSGGGFASSSARSVRRPAALSENTEYKGRTRFAERPEPAPPTRVVAPGGGVMPDIPPGIVGTDPSRDLIPA